MGDLFSQSSQIATKGQKPASDCAPSKAVVSQTDKARKSAAAIWEA